MANDYQPRDMSGVLFRNDRKDKPSHPDYRGDVTINGVTYALSSWIKTGQKGKFMSLAVSVKEDRPQQQARPSTPALDEFTEDGDLIPF